MMQRVAPCRSGISMTPNAPARRHCASRVVSSIVARAQPLTLHCDSVTMSFPVPEQQLDAMQAALDGVMQTFVAKREDVRPQRWEEMTYAYEGAAGDALEYLEVFCNPNAHASEFDAQVLVTVRAAGGMAFVGEQRLTTFWDDVEMARGG